MVSEQGSPEELDEIYVHFFWRRVYTNKAFSDKNAILVVAF